MNKTMLDLVALADFYLSKSKSLSDGRDIIEIAGVSPEEISLLLDKQFYLLQNVMSTIYGIILNSERGDVDKTIPVFAEHVARCCSKITGIYRKPEIQAHFEFYREDRKDG